MLDPGAPTPFVDPGQEPAMSLGDEGTPIYEPSRLLPPARAPGLRELARAEAERIAHEARAADKPIPTKTAVARDRRTGRVVYGSSGKPWPMPSNALAPRLPNPSLEPWNPLNCAEIKACNPLLEAGSRFEDIDMHTVTTKTLEDAPRCNNCKVTTAGANVTSDPRIGEQQ
jgi:hypothetical protein